MSWILATGKCYLEFLTKNYEKWNFWPRIKILTKNLNFDQKLKFWPKIEILTKNWNFDQKLKFLTKNPYSGRIAQISENFQKSKYWPKLKWWSKLENF